MFFSHPDLKIDFASDEEMLDFLSQGDQGGTLQ